MKKWNYTLGVDVSKNTLDISCAELNKHIKIQNTSVGFAKLKRWCALEKIKLRGSFFVMEYTGGYEYKLIRYLEARRYVYARISGLAIKKSLGISRGKNDKVDSYRIAKYGEEKYKLIQRSRPLDHATITLKELLRFRKRLVRENAGYQVTVKERKYMYNVKRTDLICKSLAQKHAANTQEIAAIEIELMKIIDGDEKLKNNYGLITGIKGIGKVNALMTIAYTENFTSFTNPRSYAVYVGVIPFDYSSGTSLKGRKRISHIAHKELKTELNQAARIAMRWNKDLKTYAEKKLESKCYKIVLNNIKFKLILRMFAVIKRNEPYKEFIG